MQRILIRLDSGACKDTRVTFTNNVYDTVYGILVQWNFLNKVKSMLKQWSKRKLTLFGRITIINSLALSKFVSLFLSLPDPTAELIKELEVFIQFLWNACPDRIARKVSIKIYLLAD